MSLKVVPPRNARTRNWYVRGTYLGVRVDRSTGTARRATAEALRRRLERDIERAVERGASSGYQRGAAPAAPGALLSFAALVYPDAPDKALVEAHLPFYAGAWVAFAMVHRLARSTADAAEGCRAVNALGAEIQQVLESYLPPETFH